MIRATPLGHVPSAQAKLTFKKAAAVGLAMLVPPMAGKIATSHEPIPTQLAQNLHSARFNFDTMTEGVSYSVVGLSATGFEREAKIVDYGSAANKANALIDTAQRSQDAVAARITPGAKLPAQLDAYFFGVTPANALHREATQDANDARAFLDSTKPMAAVYQAALAAQKDRLNTRRAVVQTEVQQMVETLAKAKNAMNATGHSSASVHDYLAVRSDAQTLFFRQSVSGLLDADKNPTDARFVALLKDAGAGLSPEGHDVAGTLEALRTFKLGEVRDDFAHSMLWHNALRQG